MAETNPSQRVRHFLTADQTMRETIEQVMQVMGGAQELPQMLDAVQDSADRMRTSCVALCQQLPSVPKDLEHAFDLDWMPVAGGGWVYVGMDEPQQSPSKPKLADLDIERTVRRPNEPIRPEHEVAAQANYNMDEINDAHKRIEKASLALKFHGDDPIAHYESPQMEAERLALEADSQLPGV